jgi:hypothetical protein
VATLRIPTRIVAVVVLCLSGAGCGSTADSAPTPTPPARAIEPAAFDAKGSQRVTAAFKRRFRASGREWYDATLGLGLYGPYLEVNTVLASTWDDSVTRELSSELCRVLLGEFRQSEGVRRVVVLSGDRPFADSASGEC